MWDDAIEDVLAGDLTAGLAYRTPAGGVVVQAVAPIGLHDREQRTVGFTTSLGFSKKLERIAKDPRVSLAFHARRHGFSRSSLYVLAQGTARVISNPSLGQRAQVTTLAGQYLGKQKTGLFWDRWLREYYVSRVPVVIDIERLVVWPDLRCAGEPRVIGKPLPDGAPPPQAPPKNGTHPRLDVVVAERRLRATDHVLLGYGGADGFPVVLPVEPGARTVDGLELRCAAPLPPGGRRAGLLGHSYRPQLIGLETRQHTGWLDGITYAPHTEVGYRAPANKTLLLLVNGHMARKGVRRGARAQ